MPAKMSQLPGPAIKAILIVDDHPLLRRGLAALIDGEADLRVCGQADGFEAALLDIRRSKPDLVIVDLQLDGSDGLELIKKITVQYPKILTLALTMHDESVYAERALRGGARGYVTKQELDDTVLIAIRRLILGEIYMSPKLATRFANKYLGGHTLQADSPLAALTDRELQVFRLIGQGQGTRQIAQLLQLSVKTIESHREHLKCKLTLESGAALVRSATRWVDRAATS